MVDSAVGVCMNVCKSLWIKFDNLHVNVHRLPVQDDQRLSPEVCPPPLQGGRAEQGGGGVPGPLRGQVPGPPREAGPQADRALGAGRGSHEESSHRK